MGTYRDNWIKAARFDFPEYIPMVFHINPSCWHHYPVELLQELIEQHPLIFQYSSDQRAPSEEDYALPAKSGDGHVDDWGCLWRTTDDGIHGTVVGHALESWDNWDSFEPPNPDKVMGWGPVDWDSRTSSLASARHEGRVAMGSLRHGHTFMLLADLRGYQNLIYDMVDDDWRLWRLIETIESFNYGVVDRYLARGIEAMGFPEDLGMQMGPMVSPPHFRKYIKPSYERLMRPVREAGCIIHMHSDGDIRLLLDDIIGAGVDIINLQDLVNGLEWIKEYLKGRSCIHLDIDRQNITRFGTPKQIDALVRQEVETLGSKAGGLMMLFGLYPGVPVQNVSAIMDAMTRYATHYSA